MLPPNSSQPGQAANGSLQKARLLNAATGAEIVVCGFNPTQLTLGKNNSWSATEAVDKNVGPVTFGGGAAASLTLELFFDTTATGEDVRTRYTNKIVDAMLYKGPPLAAGATPPADHGPPKVKFVWGRIVSFVAYIQKVSLGFNLFLQDGTPVRAMAKVTFQQAEDSAIIPPQNPTSRSAARKMWVVQEGQTLDYIAYLEYGDPACWRHIARANRLADPRRLVPGQVLNLPPLP